MYQIKQNQWLKTLKHPAFLWLILILLLIVGIGLTYQIHNNQIRNKLTQQVIQEMSGLPFVPQETCTWLPTLTEDETAYIDARANTLAHLLNSAMAQELDTETLLGLFSEGVTIATGTQDGVILIDERADFLLVSMKLSPCTHRHKYSFFPLLYVFSQTGDYWNLGTGILHNAIWIDDRWVGTVELQTDNPLYAFVHVVETNNEWQMELFGQISNGPGLIYFPDQDDIGYLQGYQYISYNAHAAYGPMPCDFGDSFQSFVSRDSCPDCAVSPSHAIYEGLLTYSWIGNNYRLVDDGSFQVTLILSDNTHLQETAPTEANLDLRASFLRPGSWRDYCET